MAVTIFALVHQAGGQDNENLYGKMPVKALEELEKSDYPAALE